MELMTITNLDLTLSSAVMIIRTLSANFSNSMKLLGNKIQIYEIVISFANTPPVCLKVIKSL